MGGLEALGQIQNINPDVKAVVSSGYSDDVVIADFRKAGFRAALAKPYTPEEMESVLGNLA
jgi:CheY-like chemotaxis protein